MNFSLADYLNQINKSSETGAITESVASTGVPTKLGLYNMLRGRVLPGILAINKLDTEQGAVFGKVRKIDSVTALEYSMNDEYFKPLELDVEIPKGQDFQYGQAVYTANDAITFSGNDFTVATQIDDALAQELIEYKDVEVSFSIEKLNVIAKSVRSKLSITQELLQDVSAIYGADIVTSAIIDSSSERITRDAIRFMRDTAVKGDDITVPAEAGFAEARKLARVILDEASEISKATGNIATYVLCSPKVKNFLFESGLVDDTGFLDDLEVRSAEFYTKGDFFLVGFCRPANESDDDNFEAPYEYGSYVYCPFVSGSFDVLDTQNMAQNMLVQNRYAISIAPIGDGHKEFKRGDIRENWLGKNVNARTLNVIFE